MIQAVLFDLDGTLTNTIDDIATAMNRALRLHGLPGWETKEYCYLVGNGAKILAQRAVRDRQDLADAVQAEYQAYYEKHTQVKTQPYDGIPELLHALAERGLKLAVLSNKPDADTKNVISHFFPDVPFSVVRGQVEGVPAEAGQGGCAAGGGAARHCPGGFPLSGRHEGGYDLCMQRGHEPSGRAVGLPHGAGAAGQWREGADCPPDGIAGEVQLVTNA